jgi:hypothetical protein
LKIAFFQNFPHATHKLSTSVSKLSQIRRSSMKFRAGFAGISRGADQDHGHLHGGVSFRRRIGGLARPRKAVMTGPMIFG